MFHFDFLRLLGILGYNSDSDTIAIDDPCYFCDLKGKEKLCRIGSEVHCYVLGYSTDLREKEKLLEVNGITIDIEKMLEAEQELHEGKGITLEEAMKARAK